MAKREITSKELDKIMKQLNSCYYPGCNISCPFSEFSECEETCQKLFPILYSKKLLGVCPCILGLPTGKALISRKAYVKKRFIKFYTQWITR